MVSTFNMLQIVVLNSGKTIIYFASCSFPVLLNNVLTAFMANRLYPDLQPKEIRYRGS